ncbi:MAG: CehA/McbA family metallohydrolase [Deltaproteobacteria bacterium]|nr:CehA/McbA family metallohydrolase [Deltaproteobacteria bacterium]
MKWMRAGTRFKTHFVAAMGLAPAVAFAHPDPPVLPAKKIYAKKIAASSDLIGGARQKAQIGDFILGNSNVRFVVGGVQPQTGFMGGTGHILDASRADVPGDLLGRCVAMAQVGRSSRYRATYTSVSVASDGADGERAVVRAVGKFSKLPGLEVTTEFSLDPDDEWVVITTTIKNAGRFRFRNIALGDALQWSNFATFVPYHGFRLPRAKVKTPWVGRNGNRVSYGYAVEKGTLAANFPPQHTRYNSAVRLFSGATTLARGKTISYRRFFLVGRGDVSDIARIIYRLRDEPFGVIEGQVTERVTGQAVPRARVSAYTKKGKMAAHAVSDAEGRFRLTLPPGSRYEVGARSSGRKEAVPGFAEVKKGEVASITLTMSRPGRVLFKVSDGAGNPIPARLFFRGLGRTKKPGFETERDENPDVAALFTHTGSGERAVPPGDYEVITTHGPAWSMSRKTITVKPAEATRLNVKLEKLIDTKGFLAGDFHVHSINSQDSIVGLEDRVISLVAEGVQIVASTDHNHVTDLRPVIAKLGLDRVIAGVPADELTTDAPTWGHFNVFPVEPDPSKPANGAFFYTGRRPRQFMSEVRERPGDKIIQVNHPRMRYGLGYFNHADWDGERAVARKAAFDPRFDTIEIYNGVDPRTTDRNLREWFKSISRGHTWSGVGNSDSHTLVYEEVGWPRTYVEVGSVAKVTYAKLIHAMREGRMIVSSGPFIRLSVAGAGPGDVIELKKGAQAVEAQISLQVEAPPWIDVSEVEIVANGRTIFYRKVSGSSVVRLKESFTHRPARDTWYVAIARGAKGIPVLPRSRLKPLAFTNPVRVSIDGNGKFDPPGLD